MKYIKKYEGVKPTFNTELRNKFIEVKNTPFKSFKLDELYNDCIKYKICFFSLIKEMILNKKIAFKSFYTYDKSEKQVIDIYRHNIIGVCDDVKLIYSQYYYDDSNSYDYYDDSNNTEYEDIVSVINNRFYVLYYFDENEIIKQKVRIYNYEEGKLMEELNTLKDSNKFNI